MINKQMRLVITFVLAMLGLLSPNGSPAYGCVRDPGSASTFTHKLHCVFTMNSQEILNGPCRRVQEEVTDPIRYFSEGDVYFVYLIKNDFVNAEAWWNRQPYAQHAHNRLGILVNDGSCWTGEQVSLCYTEYLD